MTKFHPLHEHPDRELWGSTNYEYLVIVHQEAAAQYDIMSVPLDLEYCFIRREDWKGIMKWENLTKSTGCPILEALV